MPFSIIRNDITRVEADAVVNTANCEPVVGDGVDSAIYRAAGMDDLLDERRKIGRIRPGEARATRAFGLPAKYVIHTVGPVWQGGDSGEQETLARCYRSSLELAAELGLSSVAFPLISTGTFGFPKDLALSTAISEIGAFLTGHDMNVILVVYNKEAFVLSGRIFTDVRSYIDEADVRVRSFPYQSRGRRSDSSPERYADRICGSLPEQSPERRGGLDEKDLDDFLKERGETFQQKLFHMIDHKHMDDREVYKRSNIDRKLFSKIKSNVGYNPSKRTVLAFAIGMELNLDETVDLLKSAGLAFTPASKFDLIIEYCITHKFYDILEINCMLFDNDQPTLGA